MDSNQDLQITIERIKELADNEEEEEDEYGCTIIIIITDSTITRAISLVSEADQLCTKFFKAWVNYDNNGCIYLIWSNPQSERQMHVQISANTNKPNVYIYYEEKEKYGSQLDIKSQDLSKWIDWVNADTY